jgi:hypothetical protein
MHYYKVNNLIKINGVETNDALLIKTSATTNEDLTTKLHSFYKSKDNIEFIKILTVETSNTFGEYISI